MTLGSGLDHGAQGLGALGVVTGQTPAPGPQSTSGTGGTSQGLRGVAGLEAGRICPVRDCPSRCD